MSTVLTYVELAAIGRRWATISNLDPFNRLEIGAAVTEMEEAVQDDAPEADDLAGRLESMIAEAEATAPQGRV